MKLFLNLILIIALLLPVSAQAPQQQMLLASGGFSPTQVASLKVWLKADSLALNDSDPVSSWTDSSGNSNTVTQATASKQPLYKTSIQNSKPCVLFDLSGTPDIMTSASYSAALSQPNTVFLALKMNTNLASGSRVIMDGLNSGHRNVVVATKPLTQVDWGMYAGGADESDFGPGSIQTFQILTFYFNGASSKAYVNGTLVTVWDLNTPDATHPGSNNMDGLTLGTRFDGSTFPSDPYLGELLIYNAAVSDADRASLITYLNGRWAAF